MHGYALLPADDDPDALWLLEMYADDEALRMHLDAIAALGLREELDGLRAIPTEAHLTTAVRGYLPALECDERA